MHILCFKIILLTKIFRAIKKLQGLFFESDKTKDLFKNGQFRLKQLKTRLEEAIKNFLGFV
jgi:hypothetical protein